MSNKSNDLGRAYEFSYLMLLHQEISKIRSVEIEKNSGYIAAKSAWSKLSHIEKMTYEKSSLAGIKAIFELEPMILEISNNDDPVILKIQQDNKGAEGDVRDILIIRNSVQWEIGLSIKHNNFAVKHSRLSKTIDFGDKWYEVPCSQKYWDNIKPIFDYLDVENAKKTKWRDLPDKEDKVYVPLLCAFLTEINEQKMINENILSRSMVEYLLGKFDFYKAIGSDKDETTIIQCYNLRGTLSKKSSIVVPISNLPTRILYANFVHDSKNTLEICFNNGWHFTFRIHNASTIVEPSLKFDIKIIGMPTTILSITCRWNQ